MAESFGVEGRGKFYEEAGAIRDVIQNHMLQVVAFLAMEPPTMMYVDSVRDEQVKIFRTIPPLARPTLCAGSLRDIGMSRGFRRTRMWRLSLRCAWKSTLGAGRACRF